MLPASFIAAPDVRRCKKKVGRGDLPDADRPDHARRWVRARTSARQGEVYLVGPDGLMRSDSFVDPTHRTVVASFRDPARGRVESQAIARALEGESGVQRGESFSGAQVMSAFRPVDVGGQRWALIAELPTAEALVAVDTFEAVASTSRASLLVWSAAAVVAASLAILVFGRGISLSLKRPINEMLRSIESAADGDLRDAPQVDSQDEIGRMAGRFGELLASLRENLSEIRMQGVELAGSSDQLSSVASEMAHEVGNMNSQANEVAGTADQLKKCAGRSLLDRTRTCA